MAIRSRFANYLNPVLAGLRALGGSARPGEVNDWVAADLSISDADRAVENKGGVHRFYNDVAWARFYLTRAGYLDASKRGIWTLTEQGRTAGTLSDEQIVGLQRQVQSPANEPESTEDAVEAPADDAVTDVRVGSYREQALDLLRALPPSGFERLCQRILRESGFQQVKVTGRSGDGGIDGVGILQVNAFVSFKVLFQSKRYVGSVTPSQVRDFRGAMAGRADKGLIITTGSFTADAHAEAVRDGVPQIELVDGHGLVGLLEQLELGLAPRTTYELVPGFFKEFQ